MQKVSLVHKEDEKFTVLQKIIETATLKEYLALDNETNRVSKAPYDSKSLIIPLVSLEMCHFSFRVYPLHILS